MLTQARSRSVYELRFFSTRDSRYIHVLAGPDTEFCQVPLAVVRAVMDSLPYVPAPHFRGGDELAGAGTAFGVVLSAKTLTVATTLRDELTSTTLAHVLAATSFSPSALLEMRTAVHLSIRTSKSTLQLTGWFTRGLVGTATNFMHSRMFAAVPLERRAAHLPTFSAAFL